VVSELPLRPETVPPQCLERIRETGRLFVLEEHVAHGGVGQMLACLLMEAGVYVPFFRHFHAAGYRSGRYGSQAYHRIENGLDPSTVIESIRSIARA
jgi:transketolase